MASVDCVYGNWMTLRWALQNECCKSHKIASEFIRFVFELQQPLKNEKNHPHNYGHMCLWHMFLQRE